MGCLTCWRFPNPDQLALFGGGGGSALQGGRAACRGWGGLAGLGLGLRLLGLGPRGGLWALGGGQKWCGAG